MAPLMAAPGGRSHGLLRRPLDPSGTHLQARKKLDELTGSVICGSGDVLFFLLVWVNPLREYFRYFSGFLKQNHVFGWAWTIGKVSLIESREDIGLRERSFVHS